ncbi:glycoside hydrolase family 3 C-terminal domain-containing protein [Rufibacter glacialis]|uniref:Glycoside hydrolase family 3 C-terminal domain-containing protein n=2 Tax=Rufibacter glacialis TaxID=1259555 RepID=A0ABV4RA65_9BACT|nr:glycoside hydrolase family 3 C-terminal domain-containing protein [Rufibacter glacialis]GGK64942.1 glycosyl hydrolase [Rufibacter glacialis]
MTYKLPHLKRYGCLVLVALVTACSTSEKTPQQAAALEANGINMTHEAQINELISKMTLEEKVNMIHGVSSFTSGGVARLGIPELTMSDGPHGVRPEHGRDWSMDNAGNDSATYLPTGVALAATWNPELGYAFGEVLGRESKARGKDVILGPGVNIMRTPLNGRNFEYLSEDPYLAARMAVGYIKGVQDQGVAASVKHYAANNQEIKRAKVNVEMSERALREIYLPAFKASIIEGGALTIMGAYNKFRGQYSTHNAYLINDILKGEWGFKGLVVSDWGAVLNTMEALHHGTDIEMGTDLLQMPNINYNKFLLGDTVITLVKSGQVKESLVDEKVRRILRVMYHTNMMGAQRTPGALSTSAHQQTAQKVAEEAIVLLKNEGNLLPLSKTGVKSIAVIGANATRRQAMGGGSSQVRPPYEVTPLQGIQKMVAPGVKVTYAPGFEVTREEKANQKLIDEAVQAAKSADRVVFVGGWTHGYTDDWNGGGYDAEGADKPSLTMPFAQDQLLAAVLKANPNTVVVLIGGGPIDMSRWVNQTRSILQAWYPGMEGGTALAKVLFGETNPSGKLPVTFPKRLQDSPAHALGQYPGDKDTLNLEYREDIFVGYRYFDTYKVEPLFSFGHGLSYTSFGYTGLTISRQGEAVQVRLQVKNTGLVPGAEVVQLYVKDEQASVKRPEKELKAFQKVFLSPGESKTVTLTLQKDAFQFYDAGKKQWVLEPGKFQIVMGSSSRDIRLTGDITL